jgi:pimeloyl-ACP methyl ester carboxylesterase
MAKYDKLTKTIWKGYERHDFLFDGREVIVVLPKVTAKGNPWVWRAEFFDSFPSVDMALLEKGWHLLYYKISDMYGCPESIKLMKKFHEFIITMPYNLYPKPVIFGISRGGLYAFNYAEKYPDEVSCLYLDAPVLDIRSWPGGKGTGQGYPENWKECMAIYGLTEETAKDFSGNPLDKVEKVAKAGIPIIVVAGDADTAVPFLENSAILEKRYREYGGNLKMIVKAGVGHHPHSLDNPQPIVDFILENMR